MKRGLILALCILLTLTACSSIEGVDDYKEALKRSDAVKSGRSSVDVEMVSTFHEAPIETFERFDFELRSQFSSNGTALTDIYYFNGEIGMDMLLYQPEEGKMFLKLPFADTYYKLAMDSVMQPDATPEQTEVKTLMAGLKKSWNALLMADNIFKGEKLIIENEDGQVKVRKYSIKPTSEQLLILTQSIKKVMLENSEGLAIFLKAYTQGDALSGEDLKTLIHQVFDAVTITHFEQVAHVDMDGYIVSEYIEIQLSYDNVEGFEPLFKTQTIKIASTLWDIEKNQNMDFSEITAKKIKDIESLQDDMLFEMKP